MIQRIQTVYMLACAVAILMMMLFPLASFQIPEATFELSALGLSSLTPELPFEQMGWPLFLLLLIMLALPLINIFLYKKRKLQLRVLIYVALIDLLYYGMFFWQCSSYTDQIATMTTGSVEPAYSILMLLMPALSAFCAIMAMRGVAYDMALLKSLEHLR